MNGIERVDLGRMGYADASRVQAEHHAEVLAARDGDGPLLGRVLIVEHDPVITVTPRPAAAGHVLLDEASLRSRGIAVERTDRGGDVTYHGPGQVVMYPILDLKRLRLSVHGHVRLLERAVLDAIAPLGLRGVLDATATGVWLGDSGAGDEPRPERKVAAIGVRVRKWVTLHGLAVNVSTDLAAFNLIVPCGLVGRPVTSLAAELGENAPGMAAFAGMLAGAYIAALAGRAGVG